jgi:hypothetical protein
MTQSLTATLFSPESSLASAIGRPSHGGDGIGNVAQPLS